MILDNRLQPVWFRPVPVNLVAGDLSLQTWNGKPALSWWQGYVTNTGATESGEDVVVNQHYQTVATLRGKDGWKLTLHEMIIRGHDAWVTANKDIPENLSRVRRRLQRRDRRLGGAGVRPAHRQAALQLGRAPAHPAAGLVGDAADQRLPLGRLPRQLDPAVRQRHVPGLDARHLGRLPRRHQDRQDPLDASAASTRRTRSRRTPTSSGSTTSACSRASVVTMFDDHCCQLTGGGTYVPAPRSSRAIVLKLDPKTHTATLLRHYGDDYGLAVDYMGSLQTLPNGNVFVGFGSSPYFSEFSRSGKVLLDGVLPGHDLTYRATLQQWVGRPLTDPAGAARRSGSGGTTVYASWNGATG